MSASDACPTASCIKTPVSSQSVTIVNLPEGGDSADNSSTAFFPTFLPSFSKSACLIISNPPTFPILSLLNCKVLPSDATALINNATLDSFLLAFAPSELKNTFLHLHLHNLLRCLQPF